MSDVEAYCREIETYLCRKNDGHLIRVVGPSFDLVSRWAAEGIPLKIAFRGVDRRFERYYAKGPRRRPVRIEFCEADVLEAFEEWRRAVGLTQSSVDSRQSTVDSRQSTTGSLPAHLERVVLRLTQARANGSLASSFDAFGVTINDVVLRTHTNHRLNADLRTWRLYTGHAYRNLSVSQDVHT